MQDETAQDLPGSLSVNCRFGLPTIISHSSYETPNPECDEHDQDDVDDDDDNAHKGSEDNEQLYTTKNLIFSSPTVKNKPPQT